MNVNTGLLLIRVVVGLTLSAHGYNKFFGGGRIPGTARWFESIGMKPGRFHAVLAASTEVGSGLLFAVGLFTPLAAAGFVGLMVVAAWTVNRPNGFFIANHGWEYNLVLAVVPVGVAIIGAGRYSLDRVFTFDFDSTSAFLLSAVLGGAGAVGLLAACYRPPLPSES